MRLSITGLKTIPVMGEYSEIPAYIPRIDPEQFDKEFIEDLNFISGSTFFVIHAAKEKGD